MIDNDPLYVVTSVFNPMRYKSRINLYKDFAKHIEDSGAILYTHEVAFGDRPYTVTEAGNPRHIQTRTKSELWLKENALNLAVQRLPQDWKYVAWVDADIQFVRPDWACETKHLLQHDPIIQMWSHANDLDQDHVPMQTFRSFAYCYRHNMERAGSLSDAERLGANYPYGDYDYFHPGFAHAMTREAWNALGGLIDWAILGSGDYNQCMALIGEVHKSVPKQIDKGYLEQLLIWQDRASRYIQGHFGYMPGSINHFWHGPKECRRYKDRWRILIDNKFDPEFDLKRDSFGLWQLTDRNPQLHRDIYRYFNERSEDATMAKI